MSDTTGAERLGALAAAVGAVMAEVRGVEKDAVKGKGEVTAVGVQVKHARIGDRAAPRDRGRVVGAG